MLLRSVDQTEELLVSASVYKRYAQQYDKMYSWDAEVIFLQRAHKRHLIACECLIAL